MRPVKVSTDREIAKLINPLRSDVASEPFKPSVRRIAGPDSVKIQAGYPSIGHQVAHLQGTVVPRFARLCC